MFRNTLLKQASKATATAFRQPTFTAAPLTSSAVRTISKSATSFDREREGYDPSRIEDDHDHHSTVGQRGYSEHEGQHSRTDNTIRVEYPDDESHLPSGKPVQGRGGALKRTLASFSLEDQVGVVTGGARGLGLVMSQALVTSGADVAIVDLNSELAAVFILPRSLQANTISRGGGREAGSCAC